jgi:hypothetical protein
MNPRIALCALAVILASSSVNAQSKTLRITPSDTDPAISRFNFPNVVMYD